MASQKPTTSEWIEVKHSKIHGRGVYAAKDIPKGTRIIEYVGNLVTKEESDVIADRDLEESQGHTKSGGVYLFELNRKYDIDGNVEWNTARYINHSCEPNCETDGNEQHIWIVALRDIKKGEELGYDYGYDMDDYELHPCQCGAKSCIGYIVNSKYRTRLKRKIRRKKIKGRRKRGIEMRKNLVEEGENEE